MQELDPRIVILGIEIDGIIKKYEGLAITATGTKFGNENQNECEIKIANLSGETRNQILTETSPLNKNRTPKTVTIDAGRQSYGTTRVYTGNIVTSSVTQPPDIYVVLKCLTADFQKGNIISTSQPGVASLSTISKKVADENGLSLIFEATDKQITSYNFTGPSIKQVRRLNEMGNYNAYVDDGTLVVKDLGKSLANRVKLINVDTGMIEIPEITEEGIKVKYLLDNTTTLGGTLSVKSKIYPAANGDYTIYKLSFDLASRDVPFYWIAEATRLQ